MKKILIVCSNNYTLFNALNLQKFFFNNSYEKLVIDLIFITRTDIQHGPIEKLKKKNLFNFVYICTYLNKFTIFKKILFYFFPHKFLINFNKKKDYISPQNEYDLVITQSFFLALVTKKIHKNNKFFLFDEGLSSYTGREINKSRIYYFIFNNFFKLKLEGIYLRNIKLACYKLKNFIQIDNKFDLPKKVLLEIFDLKNQYSRVLYFNSPLYGVFNLINNKRYQNKNKSLNLLKKIEKNLIKFLNDKDFEIVNHPLIETNNNFFFELGFLDRRLSNKNVLISFVSTACISPKILFNYEPNIIFLNRLLKIDFFNLDKLIFNLNKIYNHKKKIYTPKNFLELENIINGICK